MVLLAQSSRVGAFRPGQILPLKTGSVERKDFFDTLKVIPAWSEQRCLPLST